MIWDLASRRTIYPIETAPESRSSTRPMDDGCSSAGNAACLIDPSRVPQSRFAQSALK